MALYIAPARRRRRTLATAGVALAIGLLVGAAVGRTTAPSIEDRMSSVGDDARETAAGLRVIALHDEAGTGSATDDQGAELVLRRTRSDLDDLFDRAPWVGADTRRSLRDEIDALTNATDSTSTSFGEAADALATHIEEAFDATGP